MIRKSNLLLTLLILLVGLFAWAAPGHTFSDSEGTLMTLAELGGVPETVIADNAERGSLTLSGLSWDECMSCNPVIWPDRGSAAIESVSMSLCCPAGAPVRSDANYAIFFDRPVTRC